MKRFLLEFLLAVSICGLMGCAEYEENDDYESVHEKCKREPTLPICDEYRDGMQDDNGGNSNNDYE